jgi:hypothetical protein
MLFVVKMLFYEKILYRIYSLSLSCENSETVIQNPGLYLGHLRLAQCHATVDPQNLP